MIKNTSKNKVLAKDIKICKNIFAKCKGLIFSRKIIDRGLVFIFNKEKKHSIHMLFVFFPIDVLWLDKNKKVIDIKENFKPFSLLAKPKKKAKFIVELPAGTIKNSRTHIGNKIIW